VMNGHDDDDNDCCHDDGDEDNVGNNGVAMVSYQGTDGRFSSQERAIYQR